MMLHIKNQGCRSCIFRQEYSMFSFRESILSSFDLVMQRLELFEQIIEAGHMKIISTRFFTTESWAKSLRQ